jgi:cytochrome c oxidase assembly protein Cox11
VNGAFVTIDASNKVTAKAITADTDVELTASYVSNGQTITAKKLVKLINAALNSISATGLGATIFEGKTAQLAVTAAYSNSTSSAVTAQCTYEVVPPAAGSVGASGMFTAASVAADTPFAINISYMESGVTKTATVNSINKNIVVSSLTISGATQVNEGATAQYTASAAKNDASPAANVTASWSVAPTSAGTFDASGLFSAALVAADTPAVITASYTLDGVTVTDTHNITVKNVVAAVTPYFGAAATTATKDANLILSLTGRGPNASRLMNPCTITAGVGQSYYYAYPVSYGLATFVDLSNGFEGGMDGASGDRGETLGPIIVNVMVNGVSTPFYLYASDQSNLGTTNWNVM